MDDDPMGSPRRALVVIPGTVNYFYNLNGRRIAEALKDLGFSVEVKTLANCHEGDYDWCLISNITEVLSAFGDEAEGLSRIAAIVANAKSAASLSIDCVSTIWYHRIRDLSRRVGIGLIVDLGMLDQSPFLSNADRVEYRFAFSGLTSTEQHRLDAICEDDARRTIPWAFVGHTTPYRAALVDYLVQSVDPRGFVYTPVAAPYTEKGSPHLNQQQFEGVLERTRYQIWCSHHSYFYMEPERFRSSLLTGGVPVKVVHTRADVPRNAPLSYLMMESSYLGERLTEGAFGRLRRRFLSDWREFPTLAQEIARVIGATGIDTKDYSSRAA
jgi:hypothetical protein